MNKDIKAIQKAFQGKLIGKTKMKHHVARVLSKMPEETITFVTENVWFVTSFDDAWAFTFTGDDFQNKHVVFLSDDLLEENETQIHWTIAHEIGHVILGHKNRFFDKFGRDTIQEQEKAADNFARQFVSIPV